MPGRQNDTRFYLLNFQQDVNSLSWNLGQRFVLTPPRQTLAVESAWVFSCRVWPLGSSRQHELAWEEARKLPPKSGLLCPSHQLSLVPSCLKDSKCLVPFHQGAPSLTYWSSNCLWRPSWVHFLMSPWFSFAAPVKQGHTGLHNDSPHLELKHLQMYGNCFYGELKCVFLIKMTGNSALNSTLSLTDA